MEILRNTSFFSNANRYYIFLKILRWLVLCVNWTRLGDAQIAGKPLLLGGCARMFLED